MMEENPRLDAKQRAAARKLINMQVLPPGLIHKPAFTEYPIDFVKLLETTQKYRHYISTQVNRTWQLSSILGHFEALKIRFPYNAKSNQSDQIRIKRDKFDWSVLHYAVMSGSKKMFHQLKSQHLYRMHVHDPHNYSSNDWHNIALIASMRNEKDWGKLILNTAVELGKIQRKDQLIDQKTNMSSDHFAGLAGHKSHYIPTVYTGEEQFNIELKADYENNAKQHRKNGNQQEAKYHQQLADQYEIRNLEPKETYLKLCTIYNNMRPIHFAAQAGQLDFIYHCLSKNPNDVLVKGSQGKTLLHYAAEFGQYEVFDYLYSQYSKELYLEDKEGNTPMDTLLENIAILAPKKNSRRISSYGVTLRQLHLLRKMMFEYGIDPRECQQWDRLNKQTKHAVENILELQQYHQANFKFNQSYHANWNQNGTLVDKTTAVIESYIRLNRTFKELAKRVCKELKEFYQDATHTELAEYFDKLIDQVVAVNATRMTGSYTGSFISRLHFLTKQFSALKNQHERTESSQYDASNGQQFFTSGIQGESTLVGIDVSQLGNVVSKDGEVEHGTETRNGNSNGTLSHLGF